MGDMVKDTQKWYWFVTHDENDIIEIFILDEPCWGGYFIRSVPFKEGGNFILLDFLPILLTRETFPVQLVILLEAIYWEKKCVIFWRKPFFALKWANIFHNKFWLSPKTSRLDSFLLFIYTHEIYSTSASTFIYRSVRVRILKCLVFFAFGIIYLGILLA